MPTIADHPRHIANFRHDLSAKTQLFTLHLCIFVCKHLVCDDFSGWAYLIYLHQYHWGISLWYIVNWCTRSYCESFVNCWVFKYHNFNRASFIWSGAITFLIAFYHQALFFWFDRYSLYVHFKINCLLDVYLVKAACTALR